MSQLIEKIQQFASKLNHKPSDSASSRPSRVVRDSHQTIEGRCITNIPAGTITGLISQRVLPDISFPRLHPSGAPRDPFHVRHPLMLIASVIPVIMLASFLCANDSHATSSTITVGITGRPVLNLKTTTDGVFGDSGDATVTVTTDHAAGYTLTLTATGASNPTSLADGSGTIGFVTLGTEKNNQDVCPSGIDATAFNVSACNGYWGYRYNKDGTTTANDDIYHSSPSTSGDTLDTTSNSDNGTYKLSIGARADTNTAIAEYSNTFVFAVTGNPTPYTITYYDNSGEATGMPSNVTDGEASGETVTNAVSATVPTRANYTFKGWCSVSTSDDTCTDTTYNPDGDGTNRNLTLNQTSSSNSFTLYAMWKSAAPATPACTTSIPNVNITYMQDITSANKDTVVSNMTKNTQYALKDKLDNKTYCVALLADNNIWMTQNLDLEIGGAGVADLTSENTNLTTSGSGVYSTDYTNSGGVITWKPTAANTNATVTGTPATITNFTSGSPTNSVTGWTNDYNKPYMAEGADHYVYTSGVADTSTLDTIYNSASDCTTAGHSAEDCAHYYVGNYYNWTAAIASSASSGISTNYDNAANSICPKGWRLPKGRDSSDTATAREFGQLWYKAGITGSPTATSYATNGFLKIRRSPLFFVRGGNVGETKFGGGANTGNWWSSTVVSTTRAYVAYFGGTNINSAYNGGNFYRYSGRSIRCIVQ